MTNEDGKKPVHDKLNDMFGIPTASSQVPVIAEPAALPAVVDADDDAQLDADFAETRATLKELEATGKDVLDKFAQTAQDSESPRAIEVVATLMKTVADISLQKIDLHQKRKDAKAPKESAAPVGGMQIQNANIMVGTTADVLASMKNNDKPVI